MPGLIFLIYSKCMFQGVEASPLDTIHILAIPLTHLAQTNVNAPASVLTISCFNYKLKYLKLHKYSLRIVIFIF